MQELIRAQLFIALPGNANQHCLQCLQFDQFNRNIGESRPFRNKTLKGWDVEIC
jgi:hypothetical protein